MRSSLLFMLLIVFTYHCSSQRLWELHLSSQDYINIGTDSSVVALKAILRAHDQLVQLSAMQFLALRAGESERSFLLDSLHIDAIPSGAQFDWGYYFCYQLIRGYYGDQRAIAGMDTIVRFGPRGLRMTAESWLIAARQYLHFDLLKQAIPDRFEGLQAISNFAKYGRQPTYSAEVKNFLSAIILDSAYNETFWRATKGLAEYDKSLLVSLLNQRFLISDGSLRYNLFRELNTYDPEGEPERTIWAVPREQNAVSRSNYFPTYVQIAEDSFWSTRYLELPYVKFASDWLGIEQSNLVRTQLSDFLLDFKPYRPAAGMSVSAMLDTLTSHLYEVASLGWLADDKFVKELDNGLDNAKKHIAKGDPVNAYKEVQTFQDKVNKEYEKTVDDQKKGKRRDKRFVTIEAWKFLYYNAQYILDRLPSGKKK